MTGELGIPDLIREHLPEVAGTHVLHLQCGTGEATAELVQLGALVTGIDASPEALDVARQHAPSAVFIEVNVQELPLELRRHRFDVVYTGGAVLRWLHDLDAWAGGIASALRAGGTLLLYDEHPVGFCIDHLAHWREDYFAEEVDVSVGAVEEKHERHWRLGQVVNAIAGAGLVVSRLEEFRSIYAWQQRDKRIPGQFLLVATKP